MGLEWIMVVDHLEETPLIPKLLKSYKCKNKILQQTFYQPITLITTLARTQDKDHNLINGKWVHLPVC